MTMSTSDNDRVVRLGIIGAGGHATHQIYPCLSSLPVHLAAVCDLDESKAERNAQNFGADDAFTSHSDMLRSARLDAVLVCVGADHHAKLAIDVMEADLPVWTEKPPATSVEEATTMLEASRATGQACMTGFMKRFAPVYQKAHDIVESTEFGDPHLLSINWSFGVPDKSWLDMFLLDFGVHMIDLSRYLFGEVVEVYAREHNEIAYAAVLSFENGAVGTLNMTGNRGLDITEEIELTGAFGQHITIDSAGRMIQFDGGAVVGWYDRPLALQDSLIDIGYLGELREFVNAVREGRQPESSIESSVESMRLHDAIVRSAHLRQAVRVSDV